MEGGRVGNLAHDLGEHERDSPGILIWDIGVTCLGGDHD